MKKTLTSDYKEIMNRVEKVLERALLFHTAQINKEEVVRVENAVNRLCEEQQIVIKERYLKDPYKKDCEVFKEKGINSSIFAKRKKTAIQNLAVHLDLIKGGGGCMVVEMQEINRKATKEEVEAVLEKYLIYKTIEFEEKEASITPSYEFRYHGPTNQTSDQTANVAVKNVDEPEKRKRYCEWVERAVNRLSYKQRQLIIERYMKETDIFDYEVYDGILEVSVKKYSEIRERAFYTLSFILGVAVKKE